MLGSLGGSDGTQVSWFPHQALSSLSKATSYHVTCPSLRHGQYNVVKHLKGNQVRSPQVVPVLHRSASFIHLTCLGPRAFGLEAPLPPPNPKE